MRRIDTISHEASNNLQPFKTYMGEIPENRDPSYPFAQDPRKVTKLIEAQGALSAHVIGGC